MSLAKPAIKRFADMSIAQSRRWCLQAVDQATRLRGRVPQLIAHTTTNSRKDTNDLGAFGSELCLQVWRGQICCGGISVANCP
jgi:hypothetical protein